MTDLTNNMAAAWSERAQRSHATLMHAKKAPALFKPEFVEAELEALTKARAEIRRWGSM